VLHAVRAFDRETRDLAVRVLKQGTDELFLLRLSEMQERGVAIVRLATSVWVAGLLASGAAQAGTIGEGADVECVIVLEAELTYAASVA